jgi:hypothetical protein
MIVESFERPVSPSSSVKYIEATTLEHGVARCLARGLARSSGLVRSRDPVHAKIDRRLHESVGFPSDDLVAQTENHAQILVAAHHSHEMARDGIKVYHRDVALRFPALERLSEAFGGAARPLLELNRADMSRTGPKSPTPPRAWLTFR